jgi:predicted secreted protein
MAQPHTYTFGEFLIEVGDGADPEVFSAPCGLTSKSFNLQAATSDTNVPDCDDPDAPSWLERDVTSLSRDITGSGVLAEESLELWDDWATSGNPKNVQISLTDGDDGTRTWTGSYILSGFEITGQIGEKVQVNVTLVSNGEVTREDS